MVYDYATVEPLIKDTPNKRHLYNIKEKAITCLNSLNVNKGHLSIKDKPSCLNMSFIRRFHYIIAARTININFS